MIAAGREGAPSAWVGKEAWTRRAGLRGHPNVGGPSSNILVFSIDISSSSTSTHGRVFTFSRIVICIDSRLCPQSLLPKHHVQRNHRIRTHAFPHPTVWPSSLLHEPVYLLPSFARLSRPSTTPTRAPRDQANTPQLKEIFAVFSQWANDLTCAVGAAVESTLNAVSRLFAITARRLVGGRESPFAGERRVWRNRWGGVR